MFEVVGDGSPNGSVFLLNRSGILRRKIEALALQLAALRAELAGVEQGAIEATALPPIPGLHDADQTENDGHRTHPHAPSEDATGRP
ncbi:MAG TPA: hypothetical protein VM756_05415 [Burkholderiales bacterium]|nr:hypothetical protein [Burkholderiales bacterium]